VGKFTVIESRVLGDWVEVLSSHNVHHRHAWCKRADGELRHGPCVRVQCRDATWGEGVFWS
jgi:hypothetical protein